MSAAPTKVNVFNPTGPKKEGPSFQPSKPHCPSGMIPVKNPSFYEQVQDKNGTWHTIIKGEYTCISRSERSSMDAMVLRGIVARGPVS